MLPFFETPNRKVKAAQSLKKKLNKQNTRTLVYAVWIREQGVNIKLKMKDLDFCQSL